MLREIQPVSQAPGEPLRRWFQDEEFDLFVWQAEDGRIVRLQLAYDRRRFERLLTWDEGRGYTHGGVDDGERGPLTPKASPMLVADGQFDAPRIADRFRAAAADLEPGLARFVEERLRSAPI